MKIKSVARKLVDYSWIQDLRQGDVLCGPSGVLRICRKVSKRGNNDAYNRFHDSSLFLDGQVLHLLLGAGTSATWLSSCRKMLETQRAT